MSNSAQAADTVSSIFSQSSTYADNAFASAVQFGEALSQLTYGTPTFNITWAEIPQPVLADMPVAPNLPSIEFDPGGDLTQPGTVAETLPTIDIPEFGVAAPVILLPEEPPTITLPVAPTVPSVTTPSLPSAPVIDSPSVPTLLAFSPVSPPVIDLQEGWVTDKIGDIPQLTIVEPTPFRYTRGTEYVSTLFESLRDRINEGGTGLPANVEQAIWSRGKDRETQIYLTNEAEVSRTVESLGYHLPPGVLAAQLRKAQQEYFGKLSSLSRDISVKQAELEQQNILESIREAVKLEGVLVDYSYKLEALAFETAKEIASNSIQVYNAQVEQYKALVAAYDTYASVYKSLIEGQLAKVEVFKGLLSAEETKEKINSTLVDRYKVQVEAGLAEVELYKAQVAGAETLVSFEQAKISAAAEQVRAYVAQVNAETAKLEIYKAQIAGEGAKAEVYRIQADVFATTTQAEVEKTRALISRYTALVQSKQAEWAGYESRVKAEQARIEALAAQSAALLDGYKAETQTISAQAELQTQAWVAAVKEHEAKQNVALQGFRANTEILNAANDARLDAAKVGAQVFAQLAGSALGMLNANAGLNSSYSESNSNAVSFSYSGDTTSAVSPVTSVPEGF